MIKQQYHRPEKTFQESLSNQDIKEQLKNYKKIEDITNVAIGSHIKYFNIDPTTKKSMFRMGGILQKIDPQGRYITLSNGTLNWSVQLTTSILYQKMLDTEIQTELRNDIYKEVYNELSNKFKGAGSSNDNVLELKKEIQKLTSKLEEYKTIEIKYNDLIKKNISLTSKLDKIENEIKKRKK
jgi:hypothetical protein